MTSESVGTVAADISSRLAMVIGRFNRRLVPATGGLSAALLSGLATVAKHGPMRLTELAAIELVAAPTITRVVAELEQRGLVTRSPDPLDGRASFIEVSSAGMDAVLRARAARAAVVDGLMAHLAPDEVASVLAALPALERLVDQA